MSQTPAERFERQRRLASRIALYGSLVVAGLTALGLIYALAGPLKQGARQAWQDVDFASDPAVQLLQDYLRLDTTHSTGDVSLGALFLAEQLRAAGLDPVIERVGERDANVWALIEGEDPKAIVLHNHIDVEDIHQPENWNYPPFGAEIYGPWLYGRGSYDMKSIGIAQLLAIRDLAAKKKRPKKSVLFLATTDEETGSRLGTRWILEQHPELADRMELVLTEGGIVEGRDIGDFKYWGTEFGQKRYATVHVCSPSKERLEQLAEDITEYGRPPEPLVVLPEIRDFLRIYAPSRDFEDYRTEFLQPDAVIQDAFRFEYLPEYVKAYFRAEVHHTWLYEDSGSFVLPLKVHLLPGQQLEDVWDQLLPPWLISDLTWVEIPEPAADHSSPMDHPIFEKIDHAVNRVYPNTLTGPIFLPWTATDSRFFRYRGIPSYGFSPFPIFITDALHVSGPNERIALPGFVDGLEIYSALVDDLAN